MQGQCPRKRKELDQLAIYPTLPNIPAGTNETQVNPENWNVLVDNINAIAEDLIESRGDGQEFPGDDHSPGQAVDLDDILQAIKHMLADISGESNWYSAPTGSLKTHNHSSGQGGAIPWSSIGTGARKIELHPEYPGAVQTTSLRGTSPSGNNDITISTDVDVNSYVGRNYYNGTSNQTTLQDRYIVVRFTLPGDFGSWLSGNAIQVEYKTQSLLSNDCHVDIYVYKSGVANIIASSENNVNTNWSNIGVAGSILGSWSANDIMELYIKLESRSGNYARVGKISFNYNS